jgi:predicted aminopeptidase
MIMSETRLRAPAPEVMLLLSLLCAAAGCGRTAYIAEQAWGQLRVLHGRERIEEVLRRPDLPPDHRLKLELVLEVREYAHETIGLRQTGSYTRYYDTGGEPLAYNISACPKDRLEPKVWRFPIVGALPYLGFFDRAEAEAAERRLVAQGLDTYLRPVPAFSSLGWFADPVYSPMLEADVPRILDVVIHEMTHTTVFLRDQVAFNESLAVFVGNQGTLNFLALLHGPRSEQVQEWTRSIRRRRRFGRLVTDLYRRLKRLYSSSRPPAEKLARREELFAWARSRYKQIFPDPDSWGSFVKEPLNNAVLLSYGRYNQGLDFHRRVYDAVGRNLGRMVALYKRAQRFDDPVRYVAERCGLTRFVEQRM